MNFVEIQDFNNLKQRVENIEVCLHIDENNPANVDDTKLQSDFKSIHEDSTPLSQKCLNHLTTMQFSALNSQVRKIVTDMGIIKNEISEIKSSQNKLEKDNAEIKKLQAEQKSEFLKQFDDLRQMIQTILDKYQPSDDKK